jgi:hypothetical protein
LGIVGGEEGRLSFFLVQEARQSAAQGKGNAFEVGLYEAGVVELNIL